MRRRTGTSLSKAQFRVLLAILRLLRLHILLSKSNLEYLIDWLKSMVAKQNFDHLVDPKMPEVISLKELKRIILIALRCVDSDVENRPRMGDVIHMFEPCNLLLNDEFCVRHKTCRFNSLKDNEAIAKQGESA
ncbi:putative receptor-like protein kinase [Camellia lanceoleosa]|uniref:Receptor-like protein kinase n=1 Tax=Camellia lanceoleosa TaxID=1840588 RepID=A0ACC0HBB0_9ERIC|nr:putative receptor-like protein kinase [Camellia lanceoleosa]